MKKLNLDHFQVKSFITAEETERIKGKGLDTDRTVCSCGSGCVSGGSGTVAYC